MIIERLDYDLSVCQIIDKNILNGLKGFHSITNTLDEISLVIETENIDFETINRIDNFKAFRVSGVLDFSLIGILADISRILKDEKISIFAISTFNTDYILVNKDSYIKALDALERNGYIIK